MNNCVQCHEEMDRYGDAGDTQLANSDGETVGIFTYSVYRCTKPECPNYNLLQGEL